MYAAVPALLNTSPIITSSIRGLETPQNPLWQQASHSKMLREKMVERESRKVKERKGKMIFQGWSGLKAGRDTSKGSKYLTKRSGLTSSVGWSKFDQTARADPVFRPSGFIEFPLFQLCRPGSSSWDFQRYPTLCSKFITFNYLQNDGLLRPKLITEQNGTPGTLTLTACGETSRTPNLAFSRV